MKTVIKTSTRSISRLSFILLALASVGLWSSAQAVVPAPDGGYPGQNTAEGQGALLNLAGGTYNTALGWASLGHNVAGSLNTAVGAATLLTNTADQNTATGAGALLSNNSGGANTATGAFALFSNKTGNGNVAVGVSALANSTGASSNTAVGNQALRDNFVGDDNTAVGLFALATNQGGIGNTAIGEGAGQSITGNSNICIGKGVFGVAGESNTIRIGDNLPNAQSACFIGGIFIFNQPFACMRCTGQIFDCVVIVEQD